MHTYAYGNTGFDLTNIGLGTWAIGGWMWGKQEEKDSIAAILAAVEAGINWIDTAPIYGGGESEVAVGKAVAQIPQNDRPYIFTKFGLGYNTDNVVKTGSRKAVISECEASLKRLKIDSIDLLQLHWPTPEAITETAEACNDLIQQGKVKKVGVCNYNVTELQEWLDSGFPLHSLQAPYSILRPQIEEEILPFCFKNIIPVMAYSPLFRGLLFGKWDANKTFPEGDARGSHPDYSGERLIAHMEAIDEIKIIAANLNISCAALCLATILKTDGLNSVIVGARNAIQGAALAELDHPIDASTAIEVRDIITKLNQNLSKL
ncbi:MAG: aldo/keto reductase [Lentisphaeria bacterium]|nr:aldo/keto reductase [Lentisphaeria bacterium]